MRVVFIMFLFVFLKADIHTKKKFLKKSIDHWVRKIVAMVALAYSFSTSYILVHMDVVLVCISMHSMRSFFAGV